MEAANLAVGVMPLILTAIEHYDDCFRPLKRYAHFSSGIERFQRCLAGPSQVFRNQCLMMLESIREQETVHLMLSNTTNAKWKDADIETDLIRNLGSSTEAIVSTIKEICILLQDLNQREKLFEEALTTRKECTLGQQDWRRRVRAKWKYAFSDSRDKQALSELATHNSTLMALCDQSSKLEDMCTAYTSGAAKKKLNHPVQFGTIKLINQASQKVYHALKSGCSKHSEHLTRFCLEAVVEQGSARPHIKFTLAFGNTQFFMVESIIDDAGDQISSRDAKAVDVLNDAAAQGLKRRVEASEEGRVNKVKKTVRFAADTFCASSANAARIAISAPLPNLCKGKNLCDHLRSFLKTTTDPLSLLGVLGEVDCYKHLIYSPQLSGGLEALPKPEQSLQQLLQSLFQKGPTGRLSRPLQIRLVRLLAIALLQYNTTPWLRQWWQAKDIYFHSITEDSLVSNTTVVPHINVRLRDEPTQLSRITSFPLEGVGPNSFL